MFMRGAREDITEEVKNIGMAFGEVVDVLYDLDAIEEKVLDVGLDEYINTCELFDKQNLCEYFANKILESNR